MENKCVREREGGREGGKKNRGENSYKAETNTVT